MAKQLRGFAKFIEIAILIFDVIIIFCSICVASVAKQAWIIPACVVLWCVPSTVVCYGLALSFGHKAEELELLQRIAKNTKPNNQSKGV